MKTQNSEDHLDNEHYSNRLSPFLEKLQNELGAVHIDSQIKEQIRQKEADIGDKIKDQIIKQPSIYDYFSKLFQSLEHKSSLVAEVVDVITKANDNFFENLRSNKIKFSENPQDLTVLITENYKGKKYEDLARKKQIKEGNQFKQELQKKLMTIEMELDLLKAREFSSPNYKNDFKLPAENQKNIDDFIKKKASERKILEQRRKDRVVKMLEDMKKQEESLKNREKFLKEQTNKEKIDRIQKNIDDIQIRMVKREEDCQSWKTTLKELKKNAPIDPDKKFEATQRALLEKTTQEEMSKIKENLKPVDIQELKEFSKKHDEEIRLKKEQKLKELKDLRKQIKDNYKECRTSQFYEKAAEASQEKLSQLQKLQEFQEEKKKRAELFEKKRKEHYLPTIDEDKKEQVQNEISKLNNHKIKRLISKKRVEESAHLEEWDPAEAEILNPRAKGMEYLEYMRGLKKKETGSKSVDDLRSIEDKSGATISEAKDKKPKNYLKEVRGILAKKNDMRFLKNILNDSSISENLKRDQIKIQAAFWEEKARMKEEGLKFIGKKTDRKEKDGKKEEGMKDDIDEINELYLNSVKAKLALFQDHK